jgi:hypothetical protein
MAGRPRMIPVQSLIPGRTTARGAGKTLKHSISALKGYYAPMIWYFARFTLCDTQRGT